MIEATKGEFLKFCKVFNKQKYRNTVKHGRSAKQDTDFTLMTKMTDSHKFKTHVI